MSRPHRTLFLTGSSGLLGNDFLVRSVPVFDRVLLLVHKHKPRIPARFQRRVQFLKGDLTKPHLGLAHIPYKKLTAEVSHIFHAAAITDFSVSRSVAEAVNVRGVVELLDVARSAPHLESIGILSTVYSAGKRTGIIREDDLGPDNGFVNNYEASKYRMERLMKGTAQRFPYMIFRLSTIIGRQDGTVQQYGAVHRALRLYYNGLVPMVPGDPDGLVDLISSEYAADTAAWLFFHRRAQGQTYHITASRRSITLNQLLKYTAILFGKYDQTWGGRGVSVPDIVSMQTFDTFRRTVEESRNPVFSAVLTSLAHFLPELSYPKVFDDTKTRRDLRGSGISQLPLKHYYGKIIQYCLRRHWQTAPL